MKIKHRVKLMEATDIYLVPYHSYEPDHRFSLASGRFAEVERAIAAREWPYDNGDDPSFFALRHDDGLLTWGVCRRDVRTKIREGSICVFVAFTKDGELIRYRMSAVATVAEKLDRRQIFVDRRFQGKTYINILIRPGIDGWKYDENDRHEDHRHSDWLWRMSDHMNMNKKQFADRYAEIYKVECFSDPGMMIARNYVLFSEETDKTYISCQPPLVAIAENGEHERWVSADLRTLTVDTAAELHHMHRNFLRSKGRGYTHRQLTFKLPPNRAIEWRQSLISALRRS